MKRCPRCKESKKDEDFNKRSAGKNGLAYHCRDCAQKSYKAHYYREDNLDAIREKCRTYKSQNQDSVRNSRFKTLYGITLDQFNKMKEDQHGLCATCGKKPIKTLCVDHDHVTGKVRGLLCSSCNRGIGLLQDSIDILKQSVKYLRKYKDDNSVSKAESKKSKDNKADSD